MYGHEFIVKSVITPPPPPPIFFSFLSFHYTVSQFAVCCGEHKFNRCVRQSIGCLTHTNIRRFI
jgi:hypothetical protein